MARVRDPYQLARDNYPWAYQNDPDPKPSRRRQIAGDIASVAGTVLLLVGLPIVLLHLAPWPPLPIPHHLDLTRDGIRAWYYSAPWTNPDLIIRTAVTACWIAWAILLLDTAYTLVLAAVDAICDRRLRPRPTGRSPTRAAARMIVAGLIAGTVAITSRITGAHAAPPAPPSAVAADHQPHGIDLDQPVTLTTHHTHSRDRVHTVVAGDTLWDLAAHYLHDPQQWRALWRANRGRAQPDGLRLDNPGDVRPGWRLQIPTRPAPTASAPASPKRPDRPSTPGVDHHPTTPRPRPSPRRDTSNAPHHPAGRSGPISPPPAGSVPAATPGRHGAGVRLPGGSVIGVALAGVLLAGVTAVAALRWRRRFRPHQQQMLTLADTPLVRALTAAVPAGRLTEPGRDARPGERVERDPVRAPGIGAGRVDRDHDLVDGDHHANAADRDPQDGNPDERDPDDEDPDEWDPDEWDCHERSQPASADESGAGPDGSGYVLADGEHPHHGVALAGRPLTVVTGRGALDAARALFAAHLTGTIGSGHLIVASDDLAALTDLDTSQVMSLPPVIGLSVTADLDAALTLVDADLICRGRTLAAPADVTPSPQEAHGSQARHSVVFAIDPGQQQRRRMTGQLAQDGVYAVVLATKPGTAGPWTAMTVDDQGRARDLDTPPRSAQRLDLLTATDLRQLLTTLTIDPSAPAAPPPAATSQPGPVETEAPAPADPDQAEAGASESAPAGDDPAGANSSGPGEGDAIGNQRADGAPHHMQPADPEHRSDPPSPAGCPRTSLTGVPPSRPDSHSTAQQTAPAAEASSSEPAASHDAPAAAAGGGAGTGPNQATGLAKVRVGVLGVPTVYDTHGEPMPGLRARAAQILTYLALNQRVGASIEELIDAMIEGPVRRSTGANRIHTDVANLRSVLAAACGDRGPHRGGYIRKSHHRYLIDPRRVDVDLWQMRAAIEQATAAADRPRRIAALHRAVDCYHGEFGTGLDQLWVAAGRTTVANEALGAVTDLADLYLDSDPDRALGLLRRAIGWSPYTEELYRRLMRAHHQLGSPDGIRTTLHTLTVRLAEIDTRPEDETSQLASMLLSTAAQRRRPTQT